jgi:hypothetical protein
MYTTLSRYRKFVIISLFFLIPGGLPSLFIYVVIAAGQDPGRAEDPEVTEIFTNRDLVHIFMLAGHLKISYVLPSIKIAASDQVGIAQKIVTQKSFRNYEKIQT